MPKPELKLIRKPASTEGHLFDSDELAAGELAAGQPQSKKPAPVDRDEFQKNGSNIKVDGQIAGRVPFANTPLNLLTGVDQNLGAAMRVAISRGLKEAGLGFIETLYENAGGEFDGPVGSTIALKYSEKKYDVGNRYIREDEVRRACDDAFRRDGNDVIWVETEGLSEIGGGTSGTLPVGGLADAKANLKIGGIVRYRRLEPYETASGDLRAGQSFVNAANVPITASLARKMPPGGEFEITGEGQISVEPEVGKPLGYDSKDTKIGASAKVSGKIEVKGETSISVQRLPFGNEVLVKISHGKSGSADMGAEFKAGMELKARSYGQLPELGKGVLKFLLERLGLPDVLQFVKKYSQSQIGLKSQYERKSKEIARYVFDLSKPVASQAFEEIFTKFSLEKTKALLSARDPSIRSQKAGEKISLTEKGFAARMGQTKILLLSALEAERVGSVSLDGLASVEYRDSKFEKTYTNWFTGEQKIKWEQVCVDKGDNSPKQNYWHLLYTNNDRITQETEIEEFLRFCESMGIKTQGGTDECDIPPEQLAKVLADRDDTETRASIYFTNDGIKRIAQASTDECIATYLEADAQISKMTAPPKSPTLDRYREISNMWFFKRIFYWGEMSRLRQDYNLQVQGRSIVEDAKKLNDAHAFAESVRHHNFFMTLAKQSGFGFMQKISALTKLATIDETIIHELSIAGGGTAGGGRGGLKIGAQDEGEILHPERAMNRMLTKLS